MRVLLHDPPPCDACIYEGAAGATDSSSAHSLRICGAQVNLCERHWKELRDAIDKEMPSGENAIKVKEMPWADELAAEKERSKWWK